MSQPLQQPAPRGERYSENNLVWVDMEMSGLNPDSDRVLEIAIVITDAELEVVAEGPVLVAAPVRCRARWHGQLEYLDPRAVRTDSEGARVDDGRVDGQ